MSDKPKVLLAVGERALERTLTTELANEFIFVKEASYREIVIQRIRDEQPDIILIREALKGSMPIDNLILDIRQSFPSIRVVFYTRKYRPGEPLLRRLVSYGVYDFIAGESVKKQQLFEGLRQAKQLSDVRQYLDAADIQTGGPQMHVTTEYQDLSETAPAEVAYPEPVPQKKEPQKNKAGKTKAKTTPKPKKKKPKKKEKPDSQKGFFGRILPFGTDKEVEAEDKTFDEALEEELQDERKEPHKRPETFKIDVDDAPEEEVSFWGEEKEEVHQQEVPSQPKERARNPLPFFHEEPTKPQAQVPTPDLPETETVVEQTIPTVTEKSSQTLEGVVDEEPEEEEEDLFGQVIERRSTPKPKTEPEPQPTKPVAAPAQRPPAPKPEPVKSEPTLKMTTRGKPNTPNDTLTLHRQETTQEPELDFNPLEVDPPNQATIAPIPQPKPKPAPVAVEPIEHNEVRSEGWSGRRHKGAIKVANKQVVTFVGATHGVGNTHVAFNSAVKLAEEGNKVLYMECHSVFSSIDFSLQMGTWQQGIEKALEDIEHNGGMSAGEHVLRIKDIKQNARKDKALRKLYKPLPDTLDYMFYSQDYQTLEEQHRVPKERLKDLVMYLLTRENYDVIVVDSEPIGERGVDGLLNISSKVYITMTQDPAQMGVFHRQFDATQNRIKITDQRYIIVNQFVKTEPTVNRINKWTNEKVLQTVPFTHKDVVTANYLGVPFILKTKHQSAINAFDSLIEHIAE